MDRAVTAALVEEHPVVVEGVSSWIRSDQRHRIELIHVLHDLADSTRCRGALPMCSYSTWRSAAGSSRGRYPG